MKTSKFMRLGWRDIAHGFLWAFIIAAGTALYTGLSATPPKLPHTPAEWQTIFAIGLGGGIAYLLKNAGTNSKGQFGKREPETEETVRIKIWKLEKKLSKMNDQTEEYRINTQKLVALKNKLSLMGPREPREVPAGGFMAGKMPPYQDPPPPPRI